MKKHLEKLNWMLLRLWQWLYQSVLIGYAIKTWPSSNGKVKQIKDNAKIA